MSDPTKDTLLDLMNARTKAVMDVLAERKKQRQKWGDAHDDDEHDCGELSEVAAILSMGVDDIWHGPDWASTLLAKHEGNRRQQLVIAAALLLAEIERIDRSHDV